MYDAVINFSPYIGRIYYADNLNYNKGIRDDVIVTACFTGEGAALKMKDIVERYLDNTCKNADVIPIDINSVEDYNRKIAQIKQEKNILAVISSVKPEDITLKYLSPKDLLENKAESFLKSELLDKNIVLIEQMKEVVKENTSIDSEKYIKDFITFYKSLKKHNIMLNEDMIVGFILHISCAIEKIQTGTFKPKINTAQISSLKEKYPEDFKTVASALESMEKSFNISFPEKIYSNLVKVIHFL